MSLITLDEAKAYLRVDSSMEDGLIESEELSNASLLQLRSLLRTAMLYSLGYLYEHREEADHHDLVMTLRNLLSSVREGVF